jgi:hypothetical protein
LGSRTLIQQGFDYAYDKRLYDRLRAGQAQPVRQHLEASLDYQSRLCRFLENHDEARAAAAFPHGMHEAAAIITYLSPGLRFFHQGQLEGQTKRVSPHLVRAPKEHVDETLQQFYQRLIDILRHPSVQGAWRLLDCTPAWDGNWTWACFIAWCWQADDGQRRLVAVNYSNHQSQCHVALPWPDLADKSIRLHDLLSRVNYDRDGGDLIGPGLYLDLPAWGRHVFEISALS